jgi:NAD(P)-dependent dehydrogenase (short-subunit alcohol dehydrogenase family)
MLGKSCCSSLTNLYKDFEELMSYVAPQNETSSKQGFGRLSDKIAVVTGAASGIGRSIALRYANEGAHVVISDVRDSSRNPTESSQKTHEMIKLLGRRSIFVQTDVTSSESVNALIDAVVKEFGRIDIMCNNAGAAFEVHAEHKMVWEMSNETWQQSLDLNCNGVFFGTRASSRQMMKQEPHADSGDRGWIINTASVMGQVATQSACELCKIC